MIQAMVTPRRTQTSCTCTRFARPGTYSFVCLLMSSSVPKLLYGYHSPFFTFFPFSYPFTPTLFPPFSFTFFSLLRVTRFVGCVIDFHFFFLPYFPQFRNANKTMNLFFLFPIIKFDFRVAEGLEIEKML